MNDVPQREIEPELKEVLISLENLSSRYDGLTLDLKNKIQSIHNPPQLEAANKAMDDKEPSKPDDMVGCIFCFDAACIGDLYDFPRLYSSKTVDMFHFVFAEQELDPCAHLAGDLAAAPDYGREIGL